jgi:uncharacterized membrane protein YoaK (UPF0700 family)
MTTTGARREEVQAMCLSGLAGYVDTLGFVALFGLFTAHVTGNFVLIGSELARPSHGVLLIKFLAFPAFIAGVVIARLLTVALERRGRPSAAYVMTAQWLLLAGFMVAGVMASPITGTDTPWALAAGMLGAASMGIHNASSKLQFPQLTPTTVMTGNVTQLVIDLVDIARGDAAPAVRARCRKFFWPVVTFGAGAIGGAFAYVQYGFWGLLLPLAVLLYMISWQPFRAPAA